MKPLSISDVKRLYVFSVENNPFNSKTEEAELLAYLQAQSDYYSPDTQWTPDRLGSVLLFEDYVICMIHASKVLIGEDMIGFAVELHDGTMQLLDPLKFGTEEITE